MLRVRPARRRWQRALAGFVAALVSASLATAIAAPSAEAAPRPTNPTDAQLKAAERQRQADQAALNAVTAKIAAIDGEIAGQQAALDTAVQRYNQTTADLAVAVALTATQSTKLSQARDAVDTAQRALQVQLRNSFIRRAGSGGGLLTADDPTRALSTADYEAYLAQRKKTALADLSRARVAASNTEASARLAETAQRDLQAQAAQQRDTVIAAIRAFADRRTQLAKNRAVLDRQAAAAYGKVRKLRSQRAAYEAWQREQARLAAARAAAERARQEAIARQRAQQQNQNDTSVPATPVLSPSGGGAWGNPMRAGTYSISSCFCARWGTFHYGVDFAAAYDTPMYSVGAGTVVAAGGAQGFGNWVVIDHGTGEFSVYGHMRTFVVSVGQHVARGQLIAYVGSEGDSTGPHLHLEIRLGGINGTRIDPQVWLAQRGVYV
jgi:murein DD-endopeptidase MepM/ murein hydrolase activator NlpD